jgi:hypothetical protein
MAQKRYRDLEKTFKFPAGTTEATENLVLRSAMSAALTSRRIRNVPEFREFHNSFARHLEKPRDAKAPVD